MFIWVVVVLVNSIKTNIVIFIVVFVFRVIFLGWILRSVMIGWKDMDFLWFWVYIVKLFFRRVVFIFIVISYGIINFLSY